MKTLIFLLLTTLATLSCKDQASLGDSIVKNYGKPDELNRDDKNCVITYEPASFEDFYAKSQGIKGYIDKETNMPPTVTKENQNIETLLYDHYEWEKPDLKITLENSTVDISKNKYRIKVFVESK
jgi:hypothetical protein